MQKKHMFLFLLLSPSLFAAEFEDVLVQFDASRVRSHQPLSLFHDQEGFLVKDEEGVHRVPQYDVHKLLRGKDSKKAIAFAAMGKFKVNKFTNGEYSIDTAGDLKGGGPVLAWTFYVGTKVGIYGAIAGAAAGSVAAVVVTGGGAAPAVAAGANAAAGVAGASVAGLAGASTAATMGTAAVAGAVGGSAAATATVGTAVGAAAASGATVGTVEALALAAFAAGLAMPTP